LAIISVKTLLEAGVHFGHRVSRWNPKMAPYIFGRRNLIHIINLSETVKGLIRAHYFIKKLAAEGQTILFVGTKRQAKLVTRREAERARMPYVAERWLGGTLTNFTTIHTRLARLEELEGMENDGTMENMGKKMASTLRREKRKIARNLEGIRKMEKTPGAIIIVDPQKEHLAVHEAAKLNIPTIALMDTDSDPDMIDIPIPGNDDAMRSIEIVFGTLTDAIVAGRAEWDEKQKINARQDGTHTGEKQLYSRQREQSRGGDQQSRDQQPHGGGERRRFDRGNRGSQNQGQQPTQGAPVNQPPVAGTAPQQGNNQNRTPRQGNNFGNNRNPRRPYNNNRSGTRPPQAGRGNYDHGAAKPAPATTSNESSAPKNLPPSEPTQQNPN